MAHNAFGFSVNRSPLGAESLKLGLYSHTLRDLGQTLLRISEKLEEIDRIAAMRMRMARATGSLVFTEIAPHAESIAIQARLRASLLVQAKEVGAAIQQIVGLHQLDQMHSPV